MYSKNVRIFINHKEIIINVFCLSNVNRDIFKKSENGLTVGENE